MYKVSMSSVPNQDFDVYLDGVRYYFRLHLFRDMLYADVTVNDEQVIRSVRCIDRTWLIPFASANAGFGNFRFEDDARQYPDWRRFGAQCVLVYYSNAEIAEMEI